jgi:hypothetical protein
MLLLFNLSHSPHSLYLFACNKQDYKYISRCETNFCCLAHGTLLNVYVELICCCWGEYQILLFDECVGKRAN